MIHLVRWVVGAGVLGGICLLATMPNAREVMMAIAGFMILIPAPYILGALFIELWKTRKPKPKWL